MASIAFLPFRDDELKLTPTSSPWPRTLPPHQNLTFMAYILTDSFHPDTEEEVLCNMRPIKCY